MRSKKRHVLDYYKTPSFAVDALMDYIVLEGTRVFDCCSGNGEISNILKNQGIEVIENDIDAGKPAYYHFDATLVGCWPIEPYDWIVTNPPYNEAYPIITAAYNAASIGIAMLLRISFLEPTYERQSWLQMLPPSKLIVLPRISFTGDGKTDSVTVAWMVWDKTTSLQQIIVTGKK